MSTSLEDPFPLVALEAGALGVPVAGFDSGGLRELLHRSGNLAHLVAVGDVIQLARVCRRLLDNDVARASSGARLRDAVVGGNLTERLAPELWSAVGDLVGR